MIGYLLVRIEVERLVHHAVQIGHAVIGFHRERLRELEAHLLERAQIGRLDLHDQSAGRVEERALRRAFTRDELSRKYCVDSGIDTACDASPGLSSLRPVPSRPTR